MSDFDDIERIERTLLRFQIALVAAAFIAMAVVFSLFLAGAWSA